MELMVDDPHTHVTNVEKRAWPLNVERLNPSDTCPGEIKFLTAGKPSLATALIVLPGVMGGPMFFGFEGIRMLHEVEHQRPQGGGPQQQF